MMASDHKTTAPSAPTWLGRTMILLSLAVVAAAPTRAQEPDGGEGAAATELSPLALKQKLIAERFQRFEDRVFRLQEQLAEVEPENAARLQRVLERAGELGLADELQTVVRMLNEGASLNDAIDAQRAWIERADKLLSILLERDSDSDIRKDEMQRLAEYKKTLDRVLTEQRVLRDATAQAAMNARMRAQIDQAIERLNAIQKRQASLAEQHRTATEQGSESDRQDQSIAREQEALAEQSEQLGDDLKRLSELEPEPNADSEAQRQARQASGEASQSLKQASQAMKQAGGEMKTGSSQSASQSQQSAQQALQEARKKLEAAKQALDQQARQTEEAAKQKKLAEDTQKLADQMRQDASGGQPGGKPGAPGQQTPGLGNLDQAQQDMKGASESLEEQQHDQAVPKQDKAIAELEQAQKELEKALNQLRREERAETLRDLEHRFREMLSKQRAINEETQVLDRTPAEKFTRVERLQAADLADREQALSRAAATCLHILEEDATTIVFPRIIGQLSKDMSTVAQRLGAYKTGPITQSIEREIVETLEQLLDAVQQMQQENQRQAGRSARGRNNEKDEPLLPTSAELKLLKLSQLRVNERTDVVAEALQRGIETPDDAAKEFKVIAERQREAADVAREMRDGEQIPQ